MPKNGANLGESSGSAMVTDYCQPLLLLSLQDMNVASNGVTNRCGRRSRQSRFNVKDRSIEKGDFMRKTL